MCVIVLYVDMTVKTFKETVEQTGPQINVPGRTGQKAAGKLGSGGFGSQETHLLLTQTQRSPGPAAAHRVGLEKAGQDGGV